MVEEQITIRGIKDPQVLKALRKVPRHRFVPKDQQAYAYEDRPLPIGHAQTISQPYVVAWMTQLAGVDPDDKVLEIGTGSGYQAAVLAEVGAEVYSIEIVEPLAKRAEQTLADLGYENVHVRQGDGYAGWPEQAPFDAVILTAAPPEIPEPLKRQLKVGGRLIAPVGEGFQELVMLRRTKTGFERKSLGGVAFVPMTGQARKQE